MLFLTKFHQHAVTAFQEELNNHKITHYILQQRGLGGFTQETLVAPKEPWETQPKQPTHRINIAPLYRITPSDAGECEPDVEITLVVEMWTAGEHHQATPDQQDCLEAILLAILYAVGEKIVNPKGGLFPSGMRPPTYPPQVESVQSITVGDGNTYGVEGVLTLRRIPIEPTSTPQALG